MKFPSRHTLYGLSSSVSGCNHILTISHHQQPPSAINHHPQPSLFSADSHRHSSSTSIVSHHPHPSTISHIRHQSSPATIIGHHLQPSSTPTHSPHSHKSSPAVVCPCAPAIYISAQLASFHPPPPRPVTAPWKGFSFFNCHSS